MRILGRSRRLAIAVVSIGVATSFTASMAAAANLPARVTGSVEMGRVGKHHRYAVHLTMPADDVVVLGVEDKVLREVPSALWNRYAVRSSSSLSSGDLRADFGALGQVSLRFHPEESATGTVRRGCRGRPPRKEHGTYQGTIDLRGENGIFSIHRVEAPGTRRRRFPLECGDTQPAEPTTSPPLAAYVAPGLSGDGSEVRIELLSVTPERTLGLLALSLPTSPFSERQSAVLEVGPDLAIGRYSYIAGPLVFGPVESEGHGSRPPSAMLGPVTYNADPEAPATWSGDVDQQFLGGIEFVMNGPGSRTRLCFGAGRCVGESEPVLSGSPFQLSP